MNNTPLSIFCDPQALNTSDSNTPMQFQGSTSVSNASLFNSLARLPTAKPAPAASQPLLQLPSYPLSTPQIPSVSPDPWVASVVFTTEPTPSNPVVSASSIPLP
ncbi:MAG: hypothetical protein MMC33_007626 [Icmadophila ericetorum]|nr:hypothetical protein [Icmadophila ericetorum]